MLIGDWDTKRGVVNNFQYEVKLNILESLAHLNHSLRRKSIASDELNSLVHKVTGYERDCVHISNSSNENIVNEIYYRSSLLKQGDDGHFEFAHLSFQEFLCAQRMMRLQSASVLSKLLLDEWWRNTIKFYYGLTRTVDHVRVPSKIRKTGKAGLRLLEYLAEADFTSKKKRLEIFKLACVQILSMQRVTQSDIDILRPYGEDIVRELKKIANHYNGFGCPITYLTILVSLNTKLSYQILFNETGYIDDLTLTEVIEIMDKASSRIEDNDGVQWLFQCTNAIRIKVKEHKKNVPSSRMAEALTNNNWFVVRSLKPKLRDACDRAGKSEELERINSDLNSVFSLNLPQQR